ENVSAFLEGVATLSVSESTLTNNVAVGGAAGAGGTPGLGSGGGVGNVALTGGFPARGTVTNCHLSANQAIGGAGTTGGVGAGAGIANRGNVVLTVTGSTFTGNHATAGSLSMAKGGGIFSEADATLTVLDSAFIGNVATGSPSPAGGGVVLRASG